MALSAYFVEDPITRIVSITIEARAALVFVGAVMAGLSSDATGPVYHFSAEDDEWVPAFIAAPGAPNGGTWDEPGTGIYSNTINCMIGGKQAGEDGKNIMVAGGNVHNTTAPTDAFGQNYHDYGTLHYSYDGQTWQAASIPVSMPASIRTSVNPTYHATILYLAYDPETKTFYADLFRTIFYLDTFGHFSGDSGCYRDLLASNDGIAWRVETSARNAFEGGATSFGSPFLQRLADIPNNGFTRAVSPTTLTNPTGDILTYSGIEIGESNQGGYIRLTAPFLFNGEPTTVPYGARLAEGYQQGLDSTGTSVSSTGSADISSSISYAGGQFVVAGSLQRSSDEDVNDLSTPADRTIYVYTSSDGETWTKRLEINPTGHYGVSTGSSGAAVIASIDGP